MEKYTIWIIVLSQVLSACTTAWKVENIQFHPVQTMLSIDSDPSTEVLINHRHVGKSPVEVPASYEREVRIERRRVSYWKTEPGISLLLTLSSLGLYLPFSFIPIDTESRLIETGNFRGNVFSVLFEKHGKVLGQETVIARGEPKQSIFKRLEGENE